MQINKTILMVSAIRVLSTLVVSAIICVFIMLGGCTNVAGKYEESRMAALDAWEEVIGPVSDKCEDRALKAKIIESGYFPESCIPGKPYVGCYAPTDAVDRDRIYVYKDRSEDKKAKTVVHEFIHLLSTCELRQPDPLHEIKYLWDDYGTDTVEAVGKKKAGNSVVLSKARRPKYPDDR